MKGAIMFMIKAFSPSKPSPPVSMGMRICNISVATVAVAAAFYIFIAVHKFPIIDEHVIAALVAIISIAFLSEAFKHLTYEAQLSRTQESRDFFSKLRGFSFKKAEYSQNQVDRNIHRVSVSISHFQGLTLFFLMFIFLSLRLTPKFPLETSFAASIFCSAFLPWLAAGQ
uniref:Uncharacterized protein n=1 Tax=Spongospora subterranea TaxID=70186 RepID=A0A0H5R8J0_9EUKA|eukprot:CRZ04669.1 hypothetical protein [Spongospora subterranea]